MVPICYTMIAIYESCSLAAFIPLKFSKSLREFSNSPRIRLYDSTRESNYPLSSQLISEGKEGNRIRNGI